MTNVRAFVALLGVTVTIVVGSALPTAAADKPDKIVVAAFGGVWAESARKNFVPCFERKTGVKAEVVLGESAEFLSKMRANPNRSPIDVVALSEFDTLRAIREGLVSKMTTAEVPNLAQVATSFHEPFGDYAVAPTYAGMAVMYNSERIKTPPATWKELIEAIAAGKFGKKVAWPAVTYAWGPPFLWFIAHQYGGSVDVAFEKLKAMQPYVVKFWTTPVEALNLFATKDADIVLNWDGRSHAFAKSKGNEWARVYVPGPGTMASLGPLAKAKSAHPIAWEYINCVVSRDVQLAHSQMIRYPGTNTTVGYPDDLRREFTPYDRAVIPPVREVLDKIPVWIERWNKEMR